LRRERDDGGIPSPIIPFEAKPKGGGRGIGFLESVDTQSLSGFPKSLCLSFLPGLGLAALCAPSPLLSGFGGARIGLGMGGVSASSLLESAASLGGFGGGLGGNPFSMITGGCAREGFLCVGKAEMWMRAVWEIDREDLGSIFGTERRKSGPKSPNSQNQEKR